MNRTEISSTALVVVVVAVVLITIATRASAATSNAVEDRSVTERRGWRAVALPLLQQQQQQQQLLLPLAHQPTQRQQRDEEPLTCFEASLRCRSDVTCRVLIDVFTQACDESGRCPSGRVGLTDIARYPGKGYCCGSCGLESVDPDNADAAVPIDFFIY